MNCKIPVQLRLSARASQDGESDWVQSHIYSQNGAPLLRDNFILHCWSTNLDWSRRSKSSATPVARPYSTWFQCMIFCERLDLLSVTFEFILEWESQITTALSLIGVNMVTKIWEKLIYRRQICWVAKSCWQFMKNLCRFYNLIQCHATDLPSPKILKYS